MDSLPPLNALRAFDAAGRTGSINGAAAELCVTPAAISRQIRLLETHLGLRLFYRQHRGIVLTESGRQYHADVARLFAGLRRATAGLTGRPERKVFHLRAPHSVAMRWLLPRLASFHLEHPGIDVQLNTSVQPPDFEREDLDAGICMGDGHWKGLESHKVMRNELVPVCAPDKLSRLREPADLAHETLLHTLARPDYWQIWLRAAGVEHIDLMRGLRYESSALAYEAALAGYGVVIAQKALVEKELQEGTLVMPFELVVDLGAHSYYFVLPPPTYKRHTPELAQFRRWVASLAV
ncbi:transcriptional regulator GcvA [Orrella sp. JC864]|uniref:transcriptional regulator GcvA n=1 Tax=Orrella sp. JC864 TaxID=3120298 RepID=UPI003008CEB9